MPRTLADLAAEAAAQVGDLPPMERADAIRDVLRQTRPKADPDAIRKAAADAAGYTEPAAPAAARRPAAAARTRPSRGGRRARRAGRRAVRQVSGSTFGRVFRTGLYLTGLYWLLRTAGAVDKVATGARAGLTWLMDPSLTWASAEHPEPTPGEPEPAPLDPAPTR
jgi:hypothetical protein